MRQKKSSVHPRSNGRHYHSQIYLGILSGPVQFPGMYGLTYSPHLLTWPMVKLIDQFSVTELFANSCKKKITDSRIAQITTKDNTKGKQEEY